MRKPKKMSTRQEAFVREYLVDLNATAACRRAGYSSTGTTPRAQGLRNLHSPLVAAAIAKAQKRREKRTGISQDEVITGLYVEAQGLGEDTTSSSRVRAYELLGKHLGMFIERREIGRPGEFTNLTDAQVEAEIKELAERRPENTETMVM